MTKKIMTMLIAAAMLTPTMAAMAAETTEEIMPISAVTETSEYETTTIESATAADIEKYINDDTVIIGKDGKAVDAVNEGDKVFVDTYNNVAVVLDSSYEGSVDVNVYSANGGDETGTSFINQSKTLVLNISDDTEITDKDGKAVESKDLEGKLAVVYYSVTTRSLPPQTTPSKVVILGDAAVAPVESDVFTGVVESVDNGVVKTADNSISVNDATVIIGADGKAASEVKAGETIAADKKNNVIAVLPADYIGTVKTDVFNASSEDEFGNFISADKQLALNVSDETAITDLEGNKLTSADLAGKKCAVYYTIAAMSMPAQTNPDKIIVLDEAESAATVEFNGIVESYENNVIKTATDSFTVNADTVIISDDDKIEAGDKVFVNTERNIVAVTAADYEGMVKIDAYGVPKDGEFGELMSYDGNLALNIGEDAEIVDIDGNTLTKDDVKGSIAAVYYTVSTMSIPPQTNPDKIVIVGKSDVELRPSYNFTYGDKSCVVAGDDNSYVPVREVAETLGFTVGWDGENVTVSVSEDDMTAAFKVNVTELNANGDKAYISNEDLTYVPVDFFTGMLSSQFGITITAAQA